MSDNCIKPNVKGRHRANLSLNDTNLSLGNRYNQAIKNNLNSKVRFSDVTPVITHFFTKQAVATDTNNGYYRLTTKHSAAKPSRQPLAIFVSKTDLINTQQVATSTNENVVISNRYTYDIGHNDVSCDGMSELNKIPLWGNKFRRLNAVVVIPFIPFFKKLLIHTNHSGGYHA